MGNDGVPETGACAGAEIYAALGHSRFFEKCEKLRCNRGRIARRFQNDRVPAHDGSQSHASHNGAGKIPRRNYRPDSKWDVEKLVMLTWQLHRSIYIRKPLGFAGVELAKIDSLADVGVRFRPILAHFEYQPRHQFVLALAQEIGGPQQLRNALLKRRPAPAFEGAQGSFHDRFNMLLPRLLEDPDKLRPLRRL